MTVHESASLYNLGAVLRETGLKADTLRAWERRYGLPTPTRTAGGQRIYTERDISIIKWLIARVAGGLAISRAVEQWKQLVTSGLDPLLEPGSMTAPNLAKPAPDTSLANLRHSWLAASLSFDVMRAEGILNQALALYTLEAVCTEVLLRGLKQVGDSWYRGTASVQQEHVISNMVIRHLETLITLTPPPTRPYTILAGCPSGEQHLIPVLCLSLFLRRKGLGVVYLADIPGERLQATTAVIVPNLVVLAAQRLTTAAALRSMALLLQEQGIPVAYGGLVFTRLPALRARIPGFYLGDNLLEAVTIVERLAEAPAYHPPPVVIDSDARVQAGRFIFARPDIERALTLGATRVAESAYLEVANLHMSDGLTAALELGDINLMEGEISWLAALLVHRNVPVDMMTFYLASYQRAVGTVMGPDGAHIVGWLDSYLNKQTMAGKAGR